MTGAENRTVRVGTRLREAREARGLSLRQIADATKYSVRVLSALEDHRLDHLPSGLYRRAVVRNYAREVGLEEESTLLDFLLEHPDHRPLPGTAMAMVTRPTPAPSPLPRIFEWLGIVVPAVASIAYLVLVFGVPSERRTFPDGSEPRPGVEAQRVAYVGPDPFQLSLLNSSAPRRVTAVADGENADEATTERRAGDDARGEDGSAEAGGPLQSAVGGDPGH